jgi:hypothetical protein
VTAVFRSPCGQEQRRRKRAIEHNVFWRDLGHPVHSADDVLRTFLH